MTTNAPAPRRSRVPVTPVAAQPVPRARTRARNVEVDTTTENKLVEPPQELRELAITAYKENKIKNLATTKYEKARTSLTGALNDLRDESKNYNFQFKEVIDGATLTLNLTLEEGTETIIDLNKLKAMVGEKKFMEIVKATKTAIEAEAGAVVYAQVAKTVGTGKRAAKVSVAK